MSIIKTSTPKQSSRLMERAGVGDDAVIRPLQERCSSAMSAAVVSSAVAVGSVVGPSTALTGRASFTSAARSSNWSDYVTGGTCLPLSSRRLTASSRSTLVVDNTPPRCPSCRKKQLSRSIGCQSNTLVVPENVVSTQTTPTSAVEEVPELAKNWRHLHQQVLSCISLLQRELAARSRDSVRMSNASISDRISRLHDLLEAYDMKINRVKKISGSSSESSTETHRRSRRKTTSVRFKEPDSSEDEGVSRSDLRLTSTNQNTTSKSHDYVMNSLSSNSTGLGTNRITLKQRSARSPGRKLTSSCDRKLHSGRSQDGFNALSPSDSQEQLLRTLAVELQLGRDPYQTASRKAETVNATHQYKSASQRPAIGQFFVEAPEEANNSFRGSVKSKKSKRSFFRRLSKRFMSMGSTKQPNKDSKLDLKLKGVARSSSSGDLMRQCSESISTKHSNSEQLIPNLIGADFGTSESKHNSFDVL